MGAACVPQQMPEPTAYSESTALDRPVLAQATVMPSPPPVDAIVPTLVVPTPLAVEQSVQPTPRPQVSVLERIRTEGILRVGTLFNNPPMSALSERGTVEGYEADLARAIAEDWGVEVQFVQVTRQNGTAMLLSGDVDLLMASVVHERELESELAFSQPYFINGHMFLLRQDSPVNSVQDVSGLRVGVVQGTASERQLGRVLSRGELSVEPQLYLTLGQAVGALGAGEVDAVLAERVQLLSVAARTDQVRLLAEPLIPGPLAVAMRRHENALRYLVDRSLQRIAAAGDLDNYRRTWFPNVTFLLEMPVWEGLDEDTRGVQDFDTALVYPESSIVDRIRTGEAVRMAGFGEGAAPGGLPGRLDAFYRALAEEMGSRWGVTVELLPGTVDNAVALVEGGQADIAIGVTPRWNGPMNVAYTSPIIRHGKRMMRLVNSNIEGFADLRGGRWVGIFASEPGTADQVNALAESVNTAVNIFTIVNDEDAVFSLTVEKNIDVVFGDSLRLLPQVTANPELVELTDRWYSTEYYAFAVPRNDPDFWALVEVTLQEIARDGTFARLYQEYVAAGDPVTVYVWPGDNTVFLGVSLQP
ncbi:MAG: hypothetical protein Kow0077_03660 [Anaerolineae bacterium]